MITSCGVFKKKKKYTPRPVYTPPKKTTPVPALPEVSKEPPVEQIFIKTPKKKLTVEEYIEIFKPVAIREMKRSGIPASIKLAQGIWESAFGNSQLSKESNNHFGIKCKSTWTGGRVYHDDDEKGECFRKYKSADQSYKDHTTFLLVNPRYGFLFNYGMDYKKWAYGLKKAGYATDKTYPQRIISLIERYELNQYDDKFKNAKSSSKKDKSLVHTVSKGDTLYSISRKYKVSVDQLKSWNKLFDNTISINQEIIIKK